MGGLPLLLLLLPALVPARPLTRPPSAPPRVPRPRQGMAYNYETGKMAVLSQEDSAIWVRPRRQGGRGAAVWVGQHAGMGVH